MENETFVARVGSGQSGVGGEGRGNLLLRLCSHGTGSEWFRPYPGTDHFCSHGTVPLINVSPHGTGLLWFGTESE